MRPSYGVNCRRAVVLFALFVGNQALAEQICNEAIPATVPNGRYVVHGDGTVTDGSTGLMWKRCPEGLSGSDCSEGTVNKYTWQAALQQAATTELAGYTDWRVPNIKELTSLVEPRCYFPAIDITAFPNTPWNNWFWSASSNAEYDAWSVLFSYGLNGIVDKNYYADAVAVRLVRGGQLFSLLSLSVSVNGSGRVTSGDGRLACPGTCSATYAAAAPVTLSASPDPGWQFTGWGGACTGTADCTLTIEGPTAVTANFTQTSNRYQLDSPVNASFESGIGVVHGWVCEAQQVSLQVDALEPFRAAYGAERPDSQALCGDSANGFAAAINWSEYGDGEHTLRLLADGQPLTQAQVNVTTLGASYLTGRSATTTVTDFPTAGLNTPLVWSEPHQNFMVGAELRGAVRSNAAFAANAQSHWESPLAGGVESGQALIRGWSCQATRVSVTLDGTPLAIPYGSEREDTWSACGDTNNGYALAINWNDVGDGPHTLTLNLDDTPVETRPFTIATPAGQGTVTGVQSRHSVQDFPNPGDSLTLQWSEPHQNFRLTDYTAATGPTPQSYHRKVRAYFQGVLGRAPSAEELDAWSTVLLDNKGSVWRPTGDGLQLHLSDLTGWGTESPSDAEVRALVDTVLNQLFGMASGLDRRIPDYYVSQLLGGHIRPRGLVNAVLNDLAIMPRVDGSYGKPNGWTGGPGEGLLTQAQIDAYRARVEAND